MARTLVISNVDFSVNKLDTVVFNEKACTSIELNKATDEIKAIGSTSTLIATVTPADTTDTIIWSSSDNEVATVSGGVITAVGCGVATITAECGEFSDSCVVTVTHIANFGYALNRYLGKADNKEFLDGGDLNDYAIGFSATGDTRKISYSDRTFDRYPYIIPKGAAKIVITCTHFRPYGFYLNSKVYSSLTNVALALPKDDFGTQLNADGSRTVTIPAATGDYVGLDSVAFVFRYMNGTISDSAMEEITVEFTA